MYTVERIKNQQFEEIYNYEIKQGNNVLSLSYEGNLDFYMSAIDRTNYRSEKICFTIDKSNYQIYSLFDELFSDIENCYVFSTDEEEFISYEEEDMIEHIERRKEMNEELKSSSAYKRLLKRNLITWISDDRDHDYPDYVRIFKGEDAYFITFIRKSEELQFGTSIRFRNSGSSYDPFNFVFMRFFKNLQEYDPDYHQMHIEEYNVKRLAKK